MKRESKYEASSALPLWDIIDMRGFAAGVIVVRTNERTRCLQNKKKTPSMQASA